MKRLTASIEWVDGQLCALSLPTPVVFDAVFEALVKLEVSAVLGFETTESVDYETYREKLISVLTARGVCQIEGRHYSDAFTIGGRIVEVSVRRQLTCPDRVRKKYPNLFAHRTGRGSFAVGTMGAR